MADKLRLQKGRAARKSKFASSRLRFVRFAIGRFGRDF
jgi:hypothetical protein